MKTKSKNTKVILKEYNRYEIKMTIEELESLYFVCNEPKIFVIDDDRFMEGDIIEPNVHYEDTDNVVISTIYIPSEKVFELLSQKETRSIGLKRVRALVNYIAQEYENYMIGYECEEIYLHIIDETYLNDKSSYSRSLEDFDWIPDPQGIMISIPFSYGWWRYDLNALAYILKNDFKCENNEYKITGYEYADYTIFLKTNLPVDLALKRCLGENNPELLDGSVLAEFIMKTDLICMDKTTPNNPKKMLEHTIGKGNFPILDELNNYTIHYVWIKDELIAWYWNKNIPFSFKSYESKNKIIESETIHSDWVRIQAGAVYGCIEDFSGELYERWECWY